MTSTVAALYDTRAEAETAHARLSAEVNAKNLRIITRETAAAIDTLRISKEDADTYRQGVGRGAVLLVGEVTGEEDPGRVVGILKGSMSSSGGRHSEDVADSLEGPGTVAAGQEVRIPVVEEDLRVGKREVLGGGAKVRTFTREHQVAEKVVLREERLEASSRPSERRLTVDQVQSGGLLKDRVIQVSEMREEPVITKEAFVREEVVLSKTVGHRTETIQETVRRTEVDVQELPGSSRASHRPYG